MTWLDTHCHLDAPEFDSDRSLVVSRAQAAGVTQMVLPAVEVGNFKTVRLLAHEYGFGYALGIHPLFVNQAHEDDLAQLRDALGAWQDDPHLVAIGEIGLDHFVPDPDPAKSEHFFLEQLKLARAFDLPAILHVRRSVDSVLKQLRRICVKGGIAHAFNGSTQQATTFIKLGFKLGFGGAMTFERALQIRHLAQTLPSESIVLETDAPDIPPHWLYRTTTQRAAGEVARNEPAELPRIATTLAQLRGWTVEQTAQICLDNAHAALPRLAAL